MTENQDTVGTGLFFLLGFLTAIVAVAIVGAARWRRQIRAAKAGQTASADGASEFRKAFRLWFAWEPEKVEEYLESMSRQGWHLAAADGMLVNFLFRRGEPRSIRYCIDYQQKISPEYRQLFEDDGWALVEKSRGWYIWSKGYVGERPSIYTDTDSLIARNRSLLLSLIAVFCAQAPIIVLSAHNFADVARLSVAIFVLLMLVFAAVYALLIYCIFRLCASNRKLKRR